MQERISTIVSRLIIIFLLFILHETSKGVNEIVYPYITNRIRLIATVLGLYVSINNLDHFFSLWMVPQEHFKMKYQVRCYSFAIYQEKLSIFNRIRIKVAGFQLRQKMCMPDFENETQIIHFWSQTGLLFQTKTPHFWLLALF